MQDSRDAKAEGLEYGVSLLPDSRAIVVKSSTPGFPGFISISDLYADAIGGLLSILTGYGGFVLPINKDLTLA